jgi:cytochrome P450
VPSLTVDLYDPDGYLESAPHAAFAELRRTDPVHWQDVPGQAGYWAILRHADVEQVARHPELFSSEAGGIVIEDLDPPRLAQMREMLVAMDPPRHRDYRQPLVRRFMPRIVAELEDRIREISRTILRGAGPEVEFVHDVAARLPSQVFGEIMGLPPGDWAEVHRMAELVTHGQDPDFVGAEAAAGEGTRQLAGYAYAFAQARRELPPRDDVTAALLGSEFGGRRMSDLDFASFFVQIVTAGSDTTTTLLSSGLLALLEHPAAMAELRQDQSLIPGAVEEMLRWANPLHYFRRTAIADTELRGVPIKAGDKLALYYTSANRDEDVFPDPDRFDVHRRPNRHLSFGLAEHFCLGVHLARLEGRVFFEELLATYPAIELAGQPRRLRSNLVNGLTTLPVTMAR